MNYYYLLVFFLFISISFVIAQPKHEIIRYEHKVLGIKLDYPKTWKLNSADSYYSNLENIKFDDKEFNEMIQKSASVPFFFLTKYSEPYDDINPSLKINTKPFGNLIGKSLIDISNILLTQFEKLFTDYELIEAPKEISINNQKATYFKIYYTLINSEGNFFKTCSELYLVNKETFFYMIGVGTKQNESNGSRQEMQNIIKTIKF